MLLLYSLYLFEIRDGSIHYITVKMLSCYGQACEVFYTALVQTGGAVA